VPYNDAACDRDKRDHRIFVSPKLRDEASFVSSLESLLDDDRHCGLIILLFVPNNHLSMIAKEAIVRNGFGADARWVASV
jgi:hypothetical protein